MCHAKTLLLIDNQKPQILILDILRENAVRPDQNIDIPFFHARQDSFLFRRGAETRQHLHIHRIILHALHKGVVMLLCQDGGRNQEYNLFFVEHRLEGCADGNFRFPIADIPADQTVHYPGTLHIALCFLDCAELVICFLVWEEFLEFFLPGVIRRECKSLFRLAQGVQSYKFLRNILHRTAHSSFRCFPLGGT